MGITVDMRNPEWFETMEAPDSRTGSYRVMTDEGEANLRWLIRAERRNNIKWYSRITLPLLQALVAVIGALIGLVAILKK